MHNYSVINNKYGKILSESRCIHKILPGKRQSIFVMRICNGKTDSTFVQQAIVKFLITKRRGIVFCGAY